MRSSEISVESGRMVIGHWFYVIPNYRVMVAVLDAYVSSPSKVTVAEFQRRLSQGP